jgi:GNAT superfamily N-acetyltransferase
MVKRAVTGESLIIRRAARHDAAHAYRLLGALGYPDLDQAEFTNVFDALLADDTAVILIALSSSGQAVGLASLSYRPQLRLAGTLVTLDEFVIAEEARGRGVGRALLDEVKRVARSLGARRLELETSRRRESYQRGFYLKNGFVEVDSAVMRLKEELLSEK